MLSETKKGFLTIISLLAMGAVALLGSDSAFAAYSVNVTTGGDIEIDTVTNVPIVYEDAITVVSNCTSGYNFAISSSTSPVLYLGGDSSADSYFNTVDGSSTLSSSNNTNKWGYSTTANTNNGIFEPLSTTGAGLRNALDTATENDEINDSFSIYYGVNTGATMTSGAYSMADSGAIIYTVTMDMSCANYTIEFDSNYGSVDSSMTDETETQDAFHGGDDTLVANTFAAPSKGQHTNSDSQTVGLADKLWQFWGWNTEADGSGDWYKDGDTINLGTDDGVSSGSTVTLYAQWIQPTLADLVAGTATGDGRVIDHNTMQDMSPAACYNSVAYSKNNADAAHTTYGTATLIDDRDGTERSYTVAKLSDGMCWMTANLNLGGETDVTLTSDDTDLADGTTFTLPATSTTYSATNNATNINTPYLRNDITIPDYTVNSQTYSGKVVAHYNYAAATANTTTYSSTSSATYFTSSICPKNWDLPTEAQYINLRSSGGYNIDQYHNTNTSYANYGRNAGDAPYNFTYGGYRNAATDYYYQTSTGYYWTSRNYSNNTAYWTYVNNSGLYSNTQTGSK